MPSLTSSWMYQFWLHSFRLAKGWGVETITFNDSDSLPFFHHNPERMDWITEIPSPDTRYIDSLNSPNMLGESPGSSTSHGKRYAPSISSLCHWSIHIPDDGFNGYSPVQAVVNVDSFRSLLSESLETNNFTSISSSSLPLSLPLVAKAANTSNEAWFCESVALAIMSRNIILLDEILNSIRKRPIDDRKKLREELADLSPFHLAVT